jgi:excisionase family DNA binding protein
MKGHLQQPPMLVTFKQAALIIGASEYQIRMLVRNKRLTAVNIGRRQMIPRDAIPIFIENNKVGATSWSSRPENRSSHNRT